ncbi:FAD/NAD(P)-binding protein [Streptomyces monticola]|uniref:FAD/NAD(P)-binding protein n=1 Tax=Streptomyces monticola TaxID=2666263 RepID=A0ABW2JUF7_9ACTN
MFSPPHPPADPHEPGAPGTASVAVIGAGPRGLSVVERLCANAAVDGAVSRLTIHVIDPYPPGPGRVWRTDQPGELLMNTVAAQISIFADASVECAGPVVEGPSLYEWAKFSALMDTLTDYPAAIRAQVRALGPNSYPSRACYGHYLTWAFDRVRRTAPDHVRLVVHRASARRLRDRADGRQDVVLDDGSTLVAGAVVLAQGHLDAEPGAEVRALARHARHSGSVYVPPANPADVDLSRLRPGRPVALRGLGLNFFDYMALLTTGRGGSFTEDPDGHLVYRPSGREPRLIAGSRRGIPYHARGENQKGVAERHEPLFLTEGVIEELRGRARAGTEVNFKRDVWPLVSKEVEGAYYAAVLAGRQCPCAVRKFLRHYPRVARDAQAEAALLADFGLAAEDRWDWRRVTEPHERRHFDGVADYSAWLSGHLRQDARRAARGNVTDPLKAAIDVLRDLRNEIRLIVDHGGISGSSYRADLDQWYTPLNAFLSIGPPLRRVQEMAALIDAGVLCVVGPGMTADADGATGGFRIGSDLTGTQPLTADALIEARLPEPDIRTARDPLLCSLLDEGQCRAYRIADPHGQGYATGGLEVSGRPYHLVDARGRRHPARFAYGVPTEHVHWVTAAGVRPGVNSVILGDSDAIARSALHVQEARPQEVMEAG